MTAVSSSNARPGDLVEVVGHRVGDAPRAGEIIEVVGDVARPHFRVRWEDGHESLLYPGADVAIKRPAKTP